MLEGHTLRALLDPSMKAGALYHFHETLHSLTGPAFLFTSGAAFSFATLRRWELYHRWSPKLARRLIRFVSLLGIGYMLHLTYFSLRRTISEGTPEQFAVLLSMDILQCIAVSGLLLQIIVWLAPSDQWFFRVTATASVAIGLTTPLVWGLARKLPFWLATSLSGQWGSVFPLFPHLGFYLAGGAAGYLFVQHKRRAAEGSAFLLERHHGAWLAFGSVMFFVLPIRLTYTGFGDIGPGYFFPRLGFLGILMCLFFLTEGRQLPHRDSFALVGRESLVIYTSHLILLYGTPLNPNKNLLKLLGSQHNLAVIIMVMLLLIGTVFGFSFIWNRVKRNYNWKATALQLGLAGYLVYSFVSG